MSSHQSISNVLAKGLGLGPKSQISASVFGLPTLTDPSCCCRRPKTLWDAVVLHWDKFSLTAYLVLLFQIHNNLDKPALPVKQQPQPVPHG